MSHKIRHGGGASRGPSRTRNFGYQEKTAKPVLPLKLTHPQREERRAEVRMLNALKNMVITYWTLPYAKNASDEEWAVMLQALLNSVPRTMKKQILRECTEPDDEDQSDNLMVPTIAWALTRWFCRIDIPRNEAELWVGPPLFSRLKSEPPSHPPIAETG